MKLAKQQKEMYSLESEQSVLGSLLVKNDCFDEVSAIIHTEDFYIVHHKIIFNAISSLLHQGQPVDILTLEQKLKEEKNFQENGTLAYIAELVKNTPSAANAKAYAELISEYSRRRQLHCLGQYIIDNTKKHCSIPEFDHILAESEKSLFNIAINKPQDNQPVDLSQTMDKVIDRIELACQNKDPIVGTPSGFKELDFKTGGFQPGMHILAARPSMGKTACALTLAYNALEMRPNPVHMYSLEMPAAQIMQRMISLVSNLSADRLRRPLSMTEQDYGKLAHALCYIKGNWNNRFILDDESRLTPYQLRTKIRRNIRLFGKPSIIFIDYLQIMTMPGKSNKYEEVTAISAEIKSISKEVDVPIIVLSQLSRNPENRIDKRPVSSDLRDSGAIEQDADFIMLLHRDDYYAKPDDELNGLCEIIIAKHRNGPLGRVLCKFEGEYSRFSALDNTEQHPAFY
ncbi:TPA: replicative DNA helicase [Pasteurella multocida]